MFAALPAEVAVRALLMRMIAVLMPRTRETRRAMFEARSTLYGVAPAPADTPASPHPAAATRDRSRSLGYGRPLPLRVAAHFVTIALVLVAAIGSPELIAGVLSAPAGSLSALAQPAGMADVQVARAIEADSPLAANDFAVQPAVRALDSALAPAFTEVHELAEGETLGQIAALYHVSVAALYWANDLGTETVFAAGQELRIPRLNGVPHIIEDGETLESIAAAFGVNPQAITLFKANEIAPGVPLPVGREIFIPGATPLYPDEVLARFGGEAGLAGLAAVAAGTVREAETNLRSGPSRDYPKLGVLDAGRRLKLIARHEQWVKVDDGAGQAGWVRSDLLGLSGTLIENLPETNDFPPPPPRWIWPTHGTVTSPFGWRSAPFRSFHDGLDIANSAWTKIYAARSGRVFESGWCRGFGYCVKIDHGDGVTTIYGHLIKKPPIDAGESVVAGDLIGYMGSTFDRSGGGYSTGVHLHFTVKVNGKAVNPMKFLP